MHLRWKLAQALADQPGGIGRVWEHQLLAQEIGRLVGRAAGQRGQHVEQIGAQGGRRNQAQRLDQAIKEYLVVLALDPNRPDTHHNLGVVYAIKGWTNRAIDEYKIALALQPHFAMAHSNLALAFIRHGLLDQAIEECKTALTLDPNLADAYHNLGIAYAMQGRAGEAISELNKAATLNPDNQTYRDNLAKAWALKKAND